MTVRIAMMALVLTTAVLLETVVFPGLAVAGHVPAIVVLTVVAFGLTDGAETGARYGFCAGLGVDLVGGGLVGLSALIFVLLGYAAGLVRPFLTGSPLAAQLLVGGVGAALGTASYGVLASLLDPLGSALGGIVQATLVTGLYSTLLAPLVIRPVAALTRRLQTVVPG